MAAPDVSALLEDSLSDVPEPIAVAHSGGIDSTSILFALEELGKEFTAYTFVPEGHVSTDFEIARTVCERFGYDWTPVFLPTDVPTIKRDAWWIVHEVGYDRASDVECTWPFLYLMDAATEPVLVTGSCADGHFVISREARINHLHDSVASMDEFRDGLFSDPDYAQKATVERLAVDRYDYLDVRVPYAEDAFVEAFMGTSDEEINKPTKKQPILDSYPARMTQFRTRGHENMHLSDSGIRDTSEQLIETDWNPSGYKSTQGIYNAITRRDVPEPDAPIPSAPVPDA